MVTEAIDNDDLVALQKLLDRSELTLLLMAARTMPIGWPVGRACSRATATAARWCCDAPLTVGFACCGQAWT
jgi:hypothetical protein